jgi:hypothetical protein
MIPCDKFSLLWVKAYKMNTLRDYIKVYNLIPSEVCDFVVKKYQDSKKWQVHIWYSAQNNSYQSYENKELSVLYDEGLNCLEMPIQKSFNLYLEDTQNSKIISYYSPFRLNKYETGTLMRNHVDLIRRNEADGVPVLSFLGILNDDFEGGELIILGEEIKLKKGDIVIFPSTFLYPHEVKEIKKGVRYSFVTWGY